MAKKGKKLYGAPVPSHPGDYKPRLYLDLEGADVQQVEGLKVGETHEFSVRGKVVGLSQNKRTDEDGKERTTGSIQLEGFEVETLDGDNEFTELSKDD